jgi:hypothetical protein
MSYRYVLCEGEVNQMSRLICLYLFVVLFNFTVSNADCSVT